MRKKEEKRPLPVEGGSEEEEIIALSKDELEDILSEAEIVQETSEQGRAAEPDRTEIEGAEGESRVELGEEEEFDISGEIDELSPEDLENIELEESDLESFTKELESEIGEGIELPEDIQVKREIKTEPVQEAIPEEELEGIDTSDIQLEAKIDEMDLDTYLSSVKEDLDLESIELEEGELTEPPVLGEEHEELDIETGEAFKEAGIEGIEGESVTLDEAELESIEKMTFEEEAWAEEAGEEAIIPEVMAEEYPAAPPEEMEEPGKPFEGEIRLDEEEERILSEDFDLSLGAVEEIAEEVETEEVVSITGEELATLEEEEEGAEPTIEGTVEIGGEELAAVAEREEPAVDHALLNDIKTILKFMDSLLGDLPEEKIKEFSRSEYFSLYKQVFEKLDIG